MCCRFAPFAVEVLFFSSQNIFEYIHDIPLIYHIKYLIVNKMQDCFRVVCVVRYISDIFCLQATKKGGTYYCPTLDAKARQKRRKPPFSIASMYSL